MPFMPLIAAIVSREDLTAHEKMERVRDVVALWNRQMMVREEAESIRREIRNFSA